MNVSGMTSQRMYRQLRDRVDAMILDRSLKRRRSAGLFLQCRGGVPGQSTDPPNSNSASFVLRCELTTPVPWWFAIGTT